VKACHEIIDKKAFTPSPKMDLEAESPENLLHVERREPVQQVESLKAMLDSFRQGKQLGGRLVDPVWHCQIMTPTNEGSELGRKNLNPIFQAFLNPGGEQVKGHKFRVGDKIVNGKNGWFPCEDNVPKALEDIEFNADAMRDDRGGGRVFCCNGDLAGVVSLQPRYIVARLWWPDRLIRIPLLPDEREDDSDEDSADNGGKRKWDLGYVLTPHKMQGSEARVCFTLADPSGGARMLCDRSWLYTALSRASILAITIGQRSVIEAMCRKSHIWNRKTFLRERIADLRLQSIGHEWDKYLEV